jgi:hypothetical protein
MSASEEDFPRSSSKRLISKASRYGVLAVKRLVGEIVMTSKTSAGALIGAIAAASLTLLFCGPGTSARADSIPYPTPGTLNPATYSFTAAFTGDVIAYFAGSSAGFENTLGLQINGVSTGIFGLNNHTSALGDSLNLGFAHAGDVLTFVMHNISPGIGDLYSNPTLNGPYDGLPVGTQHIYSTRYTATFPIFDSIPAGVFVSFEDLPFRNSNFNYDDLNFVFTNVTAAETPVPAALPLFASGLGALGLLGWRRKKKAAPPAA